jgi:hypothetical protein
MPDGPLSLAFADGDFSVARSACHRTELSIREQAFFLSVLDELSNSVKRDFKAVLGGDTNLTGSLRYTPRLEVFAAVDIYQFRQVQNATIKTSGSGVGPASLGASYELTRRENWLLAGSARLSLPTSTLYTNVLPFGLEAGAAGRMSALPWLVVDGFLGALAETAITAGNPQPRFGLSLVAGAQASPFRRVNFVLDVDCLFGYAYALDYCAAAPGVRVQIAQGVGVELGLLIPFAGGTRYDFEGALRLSYRFADPTGG